MGSSKSVASFMPACESLSILFAWICTCRLTLVSRVMVWLVPTHPPGSPVCSICLGAEPWVVTRNLGTLEQSRTTQPTTVLARGPSFSRDLSSLVCLYLHGRLSPNGHRAKHFVSKAKQRTGGSGDSHADYARRMWSQE